MSKNPQFKNVETETLISVPKTYREIQIKAQEKSNQDSYISGADVPYHIHSITHQHKSNSINSNTDGKKSKTQTSTAD